MKCTNNIYPSRMDSTLSVYFVSIKHGIFLNIFDFDSNFNGYDRAEKLAHHGAKSIFTLILKVSDKFVEKCRRSRLFGE